MLEAILLRLKVYPSYGTEWGWVIGRAMIASALIIFSFSYLSQDHAAVASLIGGFALLGYDVVLAALLAFRRLGATLVLGAFLDNAGAAGTWWGVLALQAGNDVFNLALYLVLFPFILLAGTRLGRTLGFFQLGLSVGFALWFLLYYAQPGQYSVQELAIPVMFVVMTSAFGTHLIARLNEEKQRAIGGEASLKRALESLEASQKAAVQTERLSALGKMASGIAHDINNLVVPVVGHTELLLLNEKGLRDCHVIIVPVEAKA